MPVWDGQQLRRDAREAWHSSMMVVSCGSGWLTWEEASWAYLRNNYKTMRVW